MNKSTSENDDTQNVISEHEDGQAIPDYDPMWHVSTDLDDNELEYIDENESEYTNENE